MSDRTDGTAAPLSFMAEQMLGGMLRRLESGTTEGFGLHQCVLDLLEHHRGLAENVGDEVDLDAIETGARGHLDAGDPGEVIDRDWLVAQASAAAVSGDGSVIAPGDLVMAVLHRAEESLLEREEAVGEPDEEPKEPAASASIPLSFLAEQVLGALDGEVGRPGEGGPGPSAWLLALCQHHRDLAADAADGEIEDLETAAQKRLEASTPEGPLDRGQIVTEAGVRARDGGRSAVTPADVAAAIVELAEREPPQPEPLAAPAETTSEPTGRTRVAAAEGEIEPPPKPAPEPASEPEGESRAVRSIRPAAAKDRRAPRAEERVIRVFISSTFRDMHEEREELVKRVFPQLRKLCEQRGVTWGEVDLRWGITEQQAERGQVLPICLEEIRRCRPYFIGLLGERYGWVPHAYPQDLVEEQPWLKEHQEHSITELEILHGVLKDPEMAHHAFFYLRDPAYVASLPPEVQLHYRERPTDEEIEKYGLDEARRRAEDRRQKLEALKARIRESGFPVREDYANPVELGQLVLDDLTALIDRLYPAEEQPDPLDHQAAEHEAFAASRADVYIGRQAYLDRLDTNAQGDGDPLVVLGESGSGKSALLANWALRYRQEHPQQTVLMHFIGASPYSAGWRAMVRRIMGELKRRFDIEEEIPDEPDALRSAFANWLHMAAARGRVVLILDALNQLEDREGAPDLVWLPPEIPENVRLVVSTLPGRPLDALEARGWPTLHVEPLRPDERKALIEEYLGQYSKTLSPNRVARIAKAPQTANPLYLRALLEELRVFGVHEQLDPRIDHYLAAPTVPALYTNVLKRYERDYERHRPGLVRDAMSLLWAGRRGLTEAELLELLGSDGEPLPQAHWAPLYLAAEGSLVSRAGLIGFSHDYLRQAVRDRYLPTEKERRTAHERLADYFAARDLGPRKIDELPWQLQQAEAWQRLHDLLSDLTFFEAAWDADEFDVKARWAQVEANSNLRMVEAYRRVLDQPAQNRDHVWRLGGLLHDAGHPEEALSLLEYQVQHYRHVGDRRSLAASLGGQAVILEERGDHDAAMALMKKQEHICRELGDRIGLQASLGNQAVIHYFRGDLDGAMALSEEQERLSREIGHKGGVAASLGGQALILHDRGDLDGALALYKEGEVIHRELGDAAGLAISLGAQALILYDRGDLDGAMALHKEKERICRQLGDKHGLAMSLENQALILHDRGDLDGAMALHKEKERICRELGEKEGLQASLGNQAVILQARGDLDGAMALHKEEERICRELEYKKGVAISLGNQASILKAQGDLDGAMALHKEKERVCRELGYKRGLARSLGHQALILHGRGDLDGAMMLHEEEEDICRELGDEVGLRASLGNQASILCARGDLDGALVLYKESERIFRKQGDEAGLANLLLNQAACLAKMGRRRDALHLAEQAHRLATRDGLGDLAQQIIPFLDALRT